MKRNIILLLVLALSAITPCFSQQDILKNINSYYMKPDGYLTSYSSILNLDLEISRKFYGYQYNSVIEGLTPNSAYFKMKYPSRDPSEIGMLNISWYPKSATPSSVTIEALGDHIFDLLTVDEEIDTRVVKYVKNNDVHAGYMYNTKHNSIFFVILSLDKWEVVRGFFTINLSNSELRERFINTFINNLRFEPYTPSRANPEGRPR